MRTLLAALVTLSLLVAQSMAAEKPPLENAGKGNAVADDRTPSLTGFMSRTTVIQADSAILEKLKLADAKMRVARPLEKDWKGPETLQEAAKYINERVAMAYPPAACVEYDGVFYFSGGQSTKAVADFSSGLAVVKGKAALYRWNAKDASGEKPDENWRKPRQP